MTIEMAGRIPVLRLDSRRLESAALPAARPIAELEAHRLRGPRLGEREESRRFHESSLAARAARRMMDPNISVVNLPVCVFWRLGW